jgi:hypothetical protein
MDIPIVEVENTESRASSRSTSTLGRGTAAPCLAVVRTESGVIENPSQRIRAKRRLAGSHIMDYPNVVFISLGLPRENKTIVKSTKTNGRERTYQAGVASWLFSISAFCLSAFLGCNDDHFGHATIPSSESRIEKMNRQKRRSFGSATKK